MYKLKPGIKQNPERRWALPDRVFFACGACHILAYAFLETYPNAGFSPIWIKPKEGFTGNHILVVKDDLAFDYHGYSNWKSLWTHTNKKANHWWPGWSAALVPLPKDVLISEEKSKTYDGLWLREPGQYLNNALPRAQTFLEKYGAP